MTNENVSELYRIKQYEEQFARRLSPIMYDLGAWRALGTFGAHTWKRHDHKFEISGDRDSKRRNEVVFYEHRYDPTSTVIEYGEPSLIQQDKVQVDGFGRTFDHTGFSEDSTVEVSQEVKLNKHVEHSFSNHYEFSVESETKVSGSYSGVEFQQSLKVAFGMGFDDSETKSESTEITQTVSENFIVPAGKKVRLEWEKNNLITETPFKVKGYLDFALWLNFEDWSAESLNQGALLFKGWHKGRKEFRFNSIQEFQWFLNGRDVDYPQMSAYPTHASRESKEAMAWLFDPENRVIDAVGVKRREFDNNVGITVR